MIYIDFYIKKNGENDVKNIFFPVFSKRIPIELELFHFFEEQILQKFQFLQIVCQ